MTTLEMPELDIARVQRWCAGRVPSAVKDHVRIEYDQTDHDLTILECRPPWRSELGPEWTRHAVARLRFTKSTGLWSLYCRDSNGRWLKYPESAAVPSIQKLLDEIDRDPTGIFWG